MFVFFLRLFCGGDEKNEEDILRRVGDGGSGREDVWPGCYHVAFFFASRKGNRDVNFVDFVA